MSDVPQHRTLSDKATWLCNISAVASFSDRLQEEPEHKEVGLQPVSSCLLARLMGVGDENQLKESPNSPRIGDSEGTSVMLTTLALHSTSNIN